MNIIGVAVGRQGNGYLLKFKMNGGLQYLGAIHFNDIYFQEGVLTFLPQNFHDYWRNKDQRIVYSPYGIEWIELTENEFNLLGHIEDARNFESFSLAAFLAPLARDESAGVHVCATGTVTEENGETVVGEVGEISEKYNVFSNWVNAQNDNNASYIFVYVSEQEIKFEENNQITLIWFTPKTSVDKIVYRLENTIVVQERQKYTYTDLMLTELTGYKKSLKQIDFYFSGNKSSDLLFDPQIFKKIDEIINDDENPDAEFSLNFNTVEYYASQQRMDGQQKVPTWINNFLEEDQSYNFAKINDINDEMSVFANTLEPQLEMLIDSILRSGNEKIELNHFENDNQDFFSGNYKKRSAIVISGETGKPLWMCYSEVPDQDTQREGRICIYKPQDNDGQNEIKEQIKEITQLFSPDGKDNARSLSSCFNPFVLIGFPGTGKTETTKFFARMEHLKDNGNSEATKIFNSDDRINNRAFSDNDESKEFRSKFDWAYPSRKEAKIMMEDLVEKKLGTADNRTKEYYYNMYREIEYNVRRHQVSDSIDLAWVLQQRLDLGAKEILEPDVRRQLYICKYKTIFLINAKFPFSEEGFIKAKKRIPSIEENTWECIKRNLSELEAEGNNDLFKNMSEHAFAEYFDEVYKEHPETAAKGPRRNIYNYKNEALGQACENNCKTPCSNKDCIYWTVENIKKFHDLLKEKIWDRRFRYYLDYCQYIVVRKDSVETTADSVNKIVESKEYKNGVVKITEKPAPFYNKEKGSFAEYTEKNRFPEIWNSVFIDLPWDRFVNTHKVSEYLQNTRDDLRNYVESFSDESLECFFKNAEFMRSEFFLYHIILEKWMSEGKNIMHLFLEKKEKDWLKKKNDYLIPMLNEIIFQTSTLSEERINGYLNFMTTGNAHDLSQETRYTPEDDMQLIYNGINPMESIKTDYENAKAKQLYKEIYEYLGKRKYSRFDLIPDNAGVELFSDYLFDLYLLQTNTVQKIVMHLKPYPMFVSDATKTDFETLKGIITNKYPQISTMLTQYEKEERLIIQSDEEEFFFTPYFKDCRFVENIMKSGCELLIVKGDLNYRRLVGDLKWKWTQPIKPIIGTFVTCRCLCLRCIKSDVLLGLAEKDAMEVEKIPKSKLTSGKYATIQFI